MTTRVARRVPAAVLAAGALTILAVALIGLAQLGERTLPVRTGPPVEVLAVDRTELSPGIIAVTVRNVGADPVQVAQVFVNDSFVDYTGGTEPIDRLSADTLRLEYPWQNGQPYLISMITSSGLVVEHDVEAAVVTPQFDGSFILSMALLGIYVGVVPVMLGMLLLPLLSRSGGVVTRVLLGLTVGLLVFLAADATVEGIGLAAESGAAFGGGLLVALGAGLAFLILTAVDRLLETRRSRTGDGKTGLRLAVMIAVGIGLHNLGEGLAIGSAYAVGELALGATLVVGFALHNTTEGLAVVVPLVSRRPSLLALLGLGLLAGAPAVLGAILGAGVVNPAQSALLLGVGVGAIVNVVVQVVPSMRDGNGTSLNPPAIGGLAAGVMVMYVTGLLVSV